MKVVRSDSPLYALSAVWYGPGGGFKAGRFTVWIFGVALAGVVALLVAMVGITDNGIVNLLFGVVLGPLLAYALVPRLSGHIDHWRGFRAWLQSFIAEINAPLRRRRRTSHASLDLGRVIRS